MKHNNVRPSRMKLPILNFFWDKSFIHYTWGSILFSLLNIFLLWLFIDIFHVPTVISSAVIIGGTFILRYVFFRTLGVM